MYKTKEESSKAYRDYVDTHILCVQKAFATFGKALCCKVISNRYDQDFDDLYSSIYMKIKAHDESKYSEEEFDAYRAKFYPSEEDTDKDIIEDNFNNAWEHHYKSNSHHPEFWEAIKYDDKPSVYAIMDNEPFVEMICDWIGVSMAMKTSVLDWWDEAWKEKAEMLPKEDIEFLDKFIRDNADILNFSNS